MVMVLNFLRSDYPIQKHVLLVPKWTLRIAGYDPESRKTLPLAAWALFNWLVLCYGNYLEFSFGIYYLPSDPALGLDALCPVMSSIMAMVKLTVIWWRRDELAEIFRRIRRLTAAQDGAAKVAMQRPYYDMATRLSALVTFLGWCTSTSYSLRPIIKNIYNFFHGKEFIYETPFHMLFPPAMVAMPWFPLTFCFSHWHGYMTVCGFGGTDGLFLSICLYVATLLQSLQIDVQDLLKNRFENGRVSEKDDEDAVCEALQKIIDRHNEIFVLVSDFSGLMGEIILAHFVFSAITIGTSIIDLLLLPGYGVILYVIHAMAVTTQLLLYCMGGNAMVDSSTGLATVVYKTHWHTHSVRVQRMLLLLLLRSQRSVNVKVPFITPSLPTFTSIIRFSGSLIALIQSVLKK